MASVVNPKIAIAPKAISKPRVATPAKKVAVKLPVKLPAKVPAKVLPAATVAKPDKLKKTKMVRDSFTMPKAEFAVLDLLKSRATNLKTPTKKTELIRAGIKALAAMSDASFLAAVAAVPNLKTGRPAKS